MSGNPHVERYLVLALWAQSADVGAGSWSQTRDITLRQLREETVRTIVPVADIPRRISEAGRIRIGVKKNGFPSKLSTFRFTSSDKIALEQLAVQYGGDVHEWKDAPRPGEFELISTAKELQIALPPDPLGDSPIYEMWSGGGCIRRCDGVECAVARPSAEGGELATVPCLCTANDKMECKPKTRLNVILRGVRFAGVWRLESGGWNTAQEMPGMVDAILSLQGKGITAGLLRLEERADKKEVNGKTTTVRYVVPMLGLAEDVDSLVSGKATLGALGPASTPELRSGAVASSVEGRRDDGVLEGRVEDDVSDGEEGIVDAEIVEDEDAGTAPEEPTEERIREAFNVEPAPKKRDNRQTALVLRVKELADEHKLDHDTLRHAFARAASKGRTDKSSELEPEEKSKLLDRLDELERGEWVFLGLDWEGQIAMQRPL